MNKAFSNKRSIVLFMTPAALVFLAVMIIPIFATGYYSTLEWDGIGDATFVGIKNYISLLLDNKYEFWQSVGHSFIVLFLSVFVQETIAMVLALILAKGVKGESFFRTAFFIPMVVSTVVIAQLFLKIYNPNYGLLNTMLESLGLGRWANEWLGDPKIAIWAVFIPLIWQYIGYHMLLFYGAIKSLSTDILEAARIDGAGQWDTFWKIVMPNVRPAWLTLILLSVQNLWNYFQISTRIILPLIVPMIETCVVLAVVGSLKTFDFVYVMTNGGPVGATEVPSTIMYDLLINRSVYGEGSAAAVFIVVECLLFTVVLRYAFKKIKEKF